MPFSSILGHETVIGGLRAAHRRGRVSHAYLFSGPAGVGKRLVATAFAQLLNCTTDVADASRVDGDACGSCRPCRLIGREAHPDLILIERDGRFIKIDRVREVTRMLRFPPVEVATRVVMVKQAEWMHEAAANAILKTLEEPSPRNLFMLLTDSPNRLLPTIRSRCQEVRFSLLPRDMVRDWLVSEKKRDVETAAEIAAMSSGSFGAAERLLDPELAALRARWLGVLKRLPSYGPTDLMDLARDLAEDKTVIPSVLDVLRLGFRDAMLRAVDARPESLTFRHPAIPEMTAEAGLRALGAIDEAEEALIRNVNPTLVSEHLLMSLRRTLQDGSAA